MDKERRKKKVAFICVHNSCRSQIAEALGKYLASDVFESYSAGTQTKPQINQDAVRIMKKMHGIDMEKNQYSKLISEIPKPDNKWVLDEPTGKSDEEFEIVIKEIERKIIELKESIDQL